ncbi:proteasome-activating nucleotidase [Candidatus Woesearchaeota archaeon]|nr:proteasome-activating nucleotidase [Candidatus Woesearchaeota archaeon]
MPPKNKEILDKVIYSYSTTSNAFEEENKLLRETIERLKEELDQFKKPPLMICQVKEVMDKEAIIRLPNSNEFLVSVSSECGKLKPGDAVLVDQKNLTIIKKIPSSKHFTVESFVIIEKPTVFWSDIGGLQRQINEIQEVVELPLKKPQLFKKVGITPPKGILLHGPPGTGKTLLAKAVAASTNSTFIEIVASELVQKFIGEGAKLVKEIFQLAREKGPAIIFIDELDALAAKRIEVGTSGEREVQRTFMQFLAEIDGFKPLDNVKIIGATNRKDILDPAVIRPGRLDRLIYVPLPDEEGKKQIFKIHTKNMTLDKRMNVPQLIKKMDNFSGAEIKAACTEAGYFAIRENRTKILRDDFLKAIEKVKKEEALEGQDYMRMFG